MHKDFADWYRLVDLQPQGETIEKRWQAIEQFCESVNAAQALELIRLFYERSAQDADFLEIFRSPFKSADVTFQMRDNTAELQVLAGATIVQLLEGDRYELADVVALGIVCTDYRGRRRNISIPEIVNRARQYLVSQSESLRAPKEVPSFTKPDLQPLFSEEQLLQPFSENNWIKVANQLHVLYTHYNQTISQLAATTEEVTSHLSDLQRLRQEESNILWWLFAEYSRDLNQPMTKVGFPAVCIVAAKELAELTVVLPGPLPALAFLDKMLHTAKAKLPDTTSLQAAVNASPRAWRSQWMQRLKIADVEDLCPVLLAIKQSLETDGRDDWVPAFERAAGVKVAEAIQSLDLTYQAYEENLLVRALASC